MSFPWIRVLKIKLTNLFGSTMTFGGVGSNNIQISVKADKYLSSLKDSAVVRISNIPYDKILTIIRRKFFDIEIFAGYKNKGVLKIFDGGVMYASNSFTDVKTTELILICTSKMIAKFGQTKMSLSLNSSINLYSAINIIARRARIDKVNIDDALKKYKISGIYTMKDCSPQVWLNEVTQAYNDIEISTDASANSTLTVAKSDFDTGKIITLMNDVVDLSGGYPRCTDDGIDITVIPNYLYMPGDLLQIDNSILDISASSISEATRVYGNYLSQVGVYKIWEAHYELENREANFSVNLICKQKPMSEQS